MSRSLRCPGWPPHPAVLARLFLLRGPGCLPLAADTGYQLSNPGTSTPAQTLAGGGYTLSASASPAAPTDVAGDAYQGMAGPVCVSPAVAVVPGAATLFIARDGASLLLTWTDDGVVLESADSLNGPFNWQPVKPAPTGKSFVTPADQPARFFRLNQP